MANRCLIKNHAFGMLEPAEDDYRTIKIIPVGFINPPLVETFFKRIKDFCVSAKNQTADGYSH